MGCLFTKTVRCSRCSRSGPESDFGPNKDICLRCIRSQQERDYIRRLNALRDESIIAAASIRPRSGSSGPTEHRGRAEVTQRRSVVQCVPRYTTQSKAITKTREKSPAPARPKPKFGEYKCSECRHSWSSRRSWANMYQKCQDCGKQVYPHSQRELRKTDMTNTERPHLEHLCEKCMRLGYYCGNFGRVQKT